MTSAVSNKSDVLVTLFFLAFTLIPSTQFQFHEREENRETFTDAFLHGFLILSSPIGGFFY